MVCSKDLKLGWGKGKSDALKGDGRSSVFAYPHFGLPLGFCFHGQGLLDFSRQLHVVAVVVKNKD